MGEGEVGKRGQIYDKKKADFRWEAHNRIYRRQIIMLYT